MFSVLILSAMMLLIPTTSVANVQGYDYKYHEDKEYKEIDKKENDKPAIIIENKIPIQDYEKKEEKMNEQPIIMIKKEVVFCDSIANGLSFCPSDGPWPGPNSDRYVQQCNDEQCEDIDDSSFEIKVENANIFEGDEDGTKLTFNGERFTVTEETSTKVEKDLGNIVPEIVLSIELSCQESGFDSSYIFGMPRGGDGFIPVISCVLFEGDCNGIVQDGELKECTVKNYVVDIGLLL